jgi:hypothetical protein
MNSLAPYLLFLVVVLSAVGPARAEGPSSSNADADTEQARAVSSMALPSLAAKLRARAEARSATQADLDGDRLGAVGNEAPASVAANLPPRP